MLDCFSPSKHKSDNLVPGVLLRLEVESNRALVLPPRDPRDFLLEALGVGVVVTGVL